MRSPKETEALLERCGLEIESAEYYPKTNHTIERALKHDLTISACIICTADQ